MSKPTYAPTQTHRVAQQPQTNPRDGDIIEPETN